MTIEAPEKAAWFERRRLKLSQEQLGELFIAFLMEQDPEIFESKAEQPISASVHALRGVVRLPEDFDEREFKLKRLSNRNGRESRCHCHKRQRWLCWGGHQSVHPEGVFGD